MKEAISQAGRHSVGQSMDQSVSHQSIGLLERAVCSMHMMMLFILPVTGLHAKATEEADGDLLNCIPDVR